jgi:hypothetical protein
MDVDVIKEIPYHIKTLSNVLKAMDRVQLTDEERQAYNRIRNRINYYENKLKTLTPIKPSVQPEPSEPSEQVHPDPPQSYPELSEQVHKKPKLPKVKKPRKGKPQSKIQSKIEKPLPPIEVSPKIQIIRKPITITF